MFDDEIEAVRVVAQIPIGDSPLLVYQPAVHAVNTGITVVESILFDLTRRPG